MMDSQEKKEEKLISAYIFSFVSVLKKQDSEKEKRKNTSKIRWLLSIGGGGGLSS